MPAISHVITFLDTSYNSPCLFTASPYINNQILPPPEEFLSYEPWTCSRNSYLVQTILFSVINIKSWSSSVYYYSEYSLYVLKILASEKRYFPLLLGKWEMFREKTAELSPSHLSFHWAAVTAGCLRATTPLCSQPGN